MFFRVQPREYQRPNLDAARYFARTPIPPAEDRAAFREYGEGLSKTDLLFRAQLQPKIREWVLVADNALRNYRFVTLKSQVGSEIDFKDYEHHERLYCLLQRLTRMIIKGSPYSSLDFHRFIGFENRPSPGSIVRNLSFW